MNMFSRLGSLSADPDQGCLMLNQSALRRIFKAIFFVTVSNPRVEEKLLE